MNSADDQPAKLHRTVLDTTSRRVARTYAEALYNAAEKRGQADAVIAELDGLFDDVFQANPDFETFFLTGAVSRRAKAEVIERTMAGKVGDVFLNFLLVLNDHERLYLLPGIRATIKDLANERAGRLEVRVASAVPLPDDQRESLRRQLREAFRKEPVLDENVDPDLLGGIVVRVGDWLYDASVRTRLDNIRKQLLERGIHVPNPVG